ncbi:MAG: DUF4230 domain-containing protein [Bacteroidales bacterium]|nr:DUF4230 domain-containing protein [Bacteroidales bacterium]
MKKQNYKPFFLLLLIVAAALIFIVVKCNRRSGATKDRGLKIDETENVVTAVKNISELVTVTYYEELVLHYSKPSTKLIDKSKDEIVILAKGKVRAGFDLSPLATEDISVSGDTVQIKLPKAKITDVIINPSDFEVYHEDGKWSQDLISSIENEACAKLKANALKTDIITKADKSGKDRIQQVLKGLGFNMVIFI